MLGDAGNVFIQDETIVGIANTYVADAVIGWIVLVAAVVVFAAAAAAAAAPARRPGTEQPVRWRTEVARVAAIVVIGGVFVAVLNRARGVPLVAFIVGVILVALQYLTVHRPFGRHLYAVGGDAEAARRMGINVRKVRLVGFALAATLAAAGRHHPRLRVAPR